MTALLAVRSQMSRAIAGVIFSSGRRPISRSVPITRCSGRTLRNGDCRSWTSSASFNVSSNMASPVEFVKASTTESRSLKARVVRDEYKNAPAIAAATSAAAVAMVAHPNRRRGAMGACGGATAEATAGTLAGSVARFRRLRSLRRSAAV